MLADRQLDAGTGDQPAARTGPRAQQVAQRRHQHLVHEFRRLHLLEAAVDQLAEVVFGQRRPLLQREFGAGGRLEQSFAAHSGQRSMEACRATSNSGATRRPALASVKRGGSEAMTETHPVTEIIGGEPYRYYPLGDHVVRAPGVCGGRPTFKYTRIEITEALPALAVTT